MIAIDLSKKEELEVDPSWWFRSNKKYSNVFPLSRNKRSCSAFFTENCYSIVKLFCFTISLI